MSERDPQSIVLSRQSILLVTAVSVGLLTLCYVLGVQVGKQSAALRPSSVRGSGENLQELPAPIQEQLKSLETGEPVKAAKPAPKPEEPRNAAPDRQTPAKPEPAQADEPKWTVQLVSTTDPAEAERIAGKAKAAGFSTTTVKDRDNYKVRLSKPGSRSEIDAVEVRLKAKGFKTFPVKVS